MWIESHTLLTIAVFGPSPEALAATVLADTFDYVNWATKFINGSVSISLLKENSSKFIKTIDSGIFWKAHCFPHSILVSGILSILGFGFLFGGNVVPAYFFFSWLVHILIDYLTHPEQIQLLYPFSKSRLNLCVLKFNPANLKVELLGDVVLTMLVFLRLKA